MKCFLGKLTQLLGSVISVLRFPSGPGDSSHKKDALKDPWNINEKKKKNQHSPNWNESWGAFFQLEQDALLCTEILYMVWVLLARVLHNASGRLGKLLV